MMKQNSMQNKQSVRPKKQQPGCIWGLFRIFDFRQGYSTQRLLSDRRDGGDTSTSIGTKHSRKRLTGNSRRRKESCSSGDDVVDARMLDEPRCSSTSTGQTLIKTLIANEIINDTQGGCFSSQRSQTKVHQKQKFKTSKVVHNLQSDYGGASRLEKFDRILHPNHMERPTESIDQMPSLERFYHWYACQVSELEKMKMSDSSQDKKENVDEIQSFVYHKSSDTGDLVEDESNYLKELMDSLEILDSNKELFVKLLRDRNSLLVKHIQGLRDNEVDQRSQARSSRSPERFEISEDNREGELNTQNLHRNSTMRHKLRGQSSLRSNNMSQNSTKIVILKPGTPSVSDDIRLTSSSSYLPSHHDVANQEGDKLSSPFSLKEIKRKLRLAISDDKIDRRCESNGGVIHRIPYGSQSSEQLKESLPQRHVEAEPSRRKSRVSDSESGRQKNWRPLRPHRIIVDELSTRGCSFPENKNMIYSRSLTQPRETDATREGRRHIYEILSARSAVEPLLTKPGSRTLGRVLSLPDHILLSPRLSPPRDLSLEIQISHSEHLNLSLESSSHTKGRDPEYGELQMQDLVLENSVIEVNKVADSTEDDGASMGFQDMNFCRGYMDGIPDDNLEVTCTGVQKAGDDEQEIKSMNTGEEEINQLIVADHPPTEIVENLSKIHPDLCFYSSPVEMDNRANVECLILDPVTDIRSPVHPSSCEISEQAVLSHNVCEEPHEPSPVSVLKPAFMEDLSSPDINTPDQQETRLVNPRKIDFGEVEDSQVVDILPRSTVSSESKLTSKMYEESNTVDFEYVKSLLEASNFTSSKDFFASIDMSDQPLHETLFLLVDPPGEVSVDQLLLFDVVNEVLLDISNRFTAYHNAVLFSVPTVRPFPTGELLLEEVWESTKWHLSMHSQASRILEDIVGSDLARNSEWMDLTCSAESISIDVEVSLLEDLIEETIIEFAV